MASIILGSSSRWRRTLWEENMEQKAEYMTPDIDEKAIRHEHAETLTLLIANAKADALVGRLARERPESEALLICMDQVVRCNGIIREKPTSSEEAREFLRSYSQGDPAEVTAPARARGTAKHPTGPLDRCIPV